MVAPESTAFGALPDDGDDDALSARASAAVALAPVFVLLSLTLVVGDVLHPAAGLLGALGSVAWLVLEMIGVQRQLAQDDLAG